MLISRAAGWGVWTAIFSPFSHFTCSPSLLPVHQSPLSRIAKNGDEQRRRIFTYLVPHIFRNLTLAGTGGGGGGWCNPLPCGFSGISFLLTVRLSPFLSTSFDPGPGQVQVRSFRQVTRSVKWPHFYTKTLQSMFVWGKVKKLSVYNKVISTYKTYISDFLYMWPSGHVRDLSFVSISKNELWFMLQLELIWVESFRIRSLLILSVIFDAPPSKGHLTSSQVTNIFFYK